MELPAGTRYICAAMQEKIESLDFFGKIRENYSRYEIARTEVAVENVGQEGKKNRGKEIILFINLGAAKR